MATFKAESVVHAGLAMVQIVSLCSVITRQQVSLIEACNNLRGTFYFQKVSLKLWVSQARQTMTENRVAHEKWLEWLKDTRPTLRKDLFGDYVGPATESLNSGWKFVFFLREFSTARHHFLAAS